MFRDGKADSSGKPGDLPDCESYYFFNPLGGVIEEEFSLYLHPFFAIVLTLTAFVSATGNQKDSTDTSAHSELDEMVVSGYRAGAVSASTKTLMAEDFSGKFQDLADLLGTVSGITVHRTGGLGAYSSVQVRGSSSNQVQIFLDGIPLNSARGGAVDIGKIPLGSLQEITIYKSSAPLELIGSNAGAIIELWSKPKESSCITNASGEMGSFGYRNAGALISRRISGVDHWFSIDYSHSNNDFPYDWDPTAYRSGDEVEKRIDNQYFTSAFGQYGISLKLPGNRITITSHLSINHSENGIFWIATPDTNDGFSRKNSIDGLLKCKFTAGQNTDLILGISAKTQKQLLQRKTPFSVGNARKRELSFPYGEFSAMLMHTFTEYWNLKAFAAAEYNSYYEKDLWNQERAIPYSRRITARTGMETAWDFSQKFSGNIKGMFRFEADSSNGVTNSYFNRPKPVRTFDIFPSAEVFINYNVLPQLSIFTSGNYRYRSPGFSEKFASTEITRGKDDLLPEKRMECDASVMLNTEKLRLSFCGYVNHVYDKIIFISRSQGIFIPENLNNVYGCGLESECYLSLFPWLSMANILTIMRNKIYSDSFFSRNGKNEPYLPHIQDNCTIDLNIGKFSFRHQFVFSGGYYTGADNISDDFYKPVPELGLAITLRSIGPISISYRLDNYLKAKLYQSEGEGKSVLHTQIYHGTPKPGRMHVVALQLKM
jgi:iron complex outermembrane receptor protein